MVKIGAGFEPHIPWGIRMKKVVLGALALTMSSLAAFSAQAQTGPITGYNWSGLYLGADVGYGLGNNSTTFSPSTDPASLAFGMGSAIGGPGLPSRFNSSQSGVLGGINARYNWQFGSVIFGGELDFDGSSISGSKSVSSAGGAGGCGGTCVPSTSSVKQNLEFLTALRARLGVTPIDRLLLFVDAGPAIGHVNYSASASFPSTLDFFAGTRSQWNFGGTLGAGAEYAIMDNVTIRGQYQYINLGSQKLGMTPTPAERPAGRGTSMIANFQNEYHAFSLGVAYHFMPPAAPPATTVAAPPPPPPAAVAPAKQMFIVFFEFDKSALTADGKKVVDAAAAAYKSGKSGVAISGYTDLAGTQQYNLALSKRRADTVKQALVKDGVPASAIAESWHGKENPRVPTADGVREPQNRRVEVTM
jgi:outer membrane protein OmpA-like peptidoglycan-associated protein